LARERKTGVMSFPIARRVNIFPAAKMSFLLSDGDCWRAFLLGAVVAWSPSLLILAWLLHDANRKRD